MYLRKMSPSTTCLYSAASMWPRSLSAAAQSFSSKPRLAPLPFCRVFFVRAIRYFLGHRLRKPQDYLRLRANDPGPQVANRMLSKGVKKPFALLLLLAGRLHGPLELFKHRDNGLFAVRAVFRIRRVERDRATPESAIPGAQVEVVLAVTAGISGGGLVDEAAALYRFVSRHVQLTLFQ